MMIIKMVFLHNWSHELCLHPRGENSSAINSQDLCSTQENSLNIAYMVGFITVGLVSFPVGYLLDICGPKKARYISSALFGMSSAIWINFSPGRLDGQNMSKRFANIVYVDKQLELISRRKDDDLRFLVAFPDNGSSLFAFQFEIWIFLWNSGSYIGNGYGEPESQYLIYPAVLTMSSAGVFCSFAFFQVSAFLCHNNQSTILGLQNGAYNASAVVLHVIKVLYEIQKLFKIEVLLSLYCGFSAILVLIATAIFVPSKEQLMAHAAKRKLLKDSLYGENVEVSTKICVSLVDEKIEKEEEEKFNQDEKDDSTWAVSPAKKIWSNRGSVQSLEKVCDMDNMKLTTFNVILQGSKLSIDSFLDGPPKQEEIQTGNSQVDKSSLAKLLISGIFLWHVFFASIFHLRLYFFVTTFESLLKSIPGVNEKTVNNYINIFGIGQFVGVIFAPVLGPYIDRIPKLSKNSSYEDYRIWKIKRCAVALRITCTINIIMGISVLVPILEAQILAILAQILLRGFFYAVHFTYFAVMFPPEHYGKVTCLSLLMGVVFGSLQYPLCLVTEKKLDSNPFWVNVALLVASLLVYGQTIHLSKYVKRKEKSSNCECVNTESNMDKKGCQLLSLHI
ncbi:large neutral amino acids transporter small subunit 4-like isoform X2 [Rhopilema esculentum]|uniref:large neutral amino acids transporter small subunit 4-like isoform X2 n=1 Tax=Rhopilema esculentum TaxID=499914 RepID=UPI0031D27B25